VTLMVSPENAERLTLATRFEPVRLALRNYGDNQGVGTPGLSTATLFGTQERKAVVPAPQAAPSPPPPGPPPGRPARRPRHSVEVLLGEKVTRQDIF